MNSKENFSREPCIKSLHLWTAVQESLPYEESVKPELEFGSLVMTHWNNSMMVDNSFTSAV